MSFELTKNAQVEIITIGDEILIGQIVDTNSAWMAKELNAIGLSVVQITSISDSREAILSTIDLAGKRAKVVLITGGLGPTKDDITKATLMDYFGGEPVFSEAQYEEVEKLFKSFGRDVSAINRKQAEVPSSCRILVNSRGTAPGMWFEKDDTIYISMPGVPYEMKWLMESQVIPALKSRLILPVIEHKTFLTQGVGESMLSEWIETWENNLPHHIKLAYLPSPGLVRLRLSAFGDDALSLSADLEAQAKGLYELVGEHIYGEGDISFAEVIQKLFLEKNLSLSLAESCTGGNIAHLLTEVAGSSAYFKGGAVTYSEELKKSILGVSQETIEQYGVVSEQVVTEMAQGARLKFGSDYSIAVTGIAGPDGGSEEMPVGSIWIGIGTPRGVIAKLHRFSTNRSRNITMASLSAFKMLRKAIHES